MDKKKIEHILNLLNNEDILLFDEGGSFVRFGDLSGFCYERVAEGNESVFSIFPEMTFLKWKSIWRELEGGIVKRHERELMRIDSMLFPVLCSMSVVSIENQKYGLIVLHQIGEHAIQTEVLNQISRLTNSVYWQWDLVLDEFVLSTNAGQFIRGDLPSKKSLFSVIRWCKAQFEEESFRQFISDLKRALYAGKPSSGVVQFNEHLDLELSYHLFAEFVDGFSYHISGLFQNQTKENQFSETLIRSEFTLENAREMIFWIDKDAQVKFTNHVVSDELGYTREEILKLKIFDFTDTKVEEWKHIWSEMLNRSHAKQNEVFIRKDGSTFPVQLDVNHIVYKGEHYHCTYARDLSEIKTKEHQLEVALAEISKLNEKLQQDKTILLDEISAKYNFDNIITQSKSYRNVLNQVAQVADTDTTVLIYGETGTGKELLARAIHSLSDRSDTPMIKVNCATLPENLIESELFGHVKGAFTGAYNSKFGKFELAHNGTIFLDEIGELPVEVQAKLLRVLQEGELERVGAESTTKVDVRVIAATNRNLSKMIDENLFRQDLFFRLNIFPIHNLPLRDRKDDIPLLTQFFMKKYSAKMNKEVVKVTTGDLKKMMNYSFPGNVRELENIINRAIIYSTGDTLNLASVLPDLIHTKKDKDGQPFLTFDDMLRKHILTALEMTDWKITGNKSASELLGLNGKTLASKMRKLGIVRK